MEATTENEDVPLNIYIPEPDIILLVLLSFLAGFLYRRYYDNETISEAYDEGFEKGAYSVVDAVSELIGKDISIDFGKEQDNED